MNNIPLPELEPGSVARVADLHVEQADATRLKAMGICVGREVQLIQAGDPLVLRVLGTRVGVSARLADGIEVIAVPEDNPTPA